MNIKHWGFVASSGSNGWYATQIDNEVIRFSKPVNALQIDSDTTALQIKINDSTDILYIDTGDSYGIDEMTIYQIQVMNPMGTKIRWKGLVE